MLKKTIAFKDYNGDDREETFHFNLTQSEITQMELGTTGGLSKKLEMIINSKDIPEIIAMFKYIILASYGEKSADGRRFVKSQELSRDFSQTEAFDIMYMSFVNDAALAAAFIEGIIPKIDNQQAK